jgi:peptidylprolyl isomerase
VRLFLLALALCLFAGCINKYPGADVVLHTEHGDIAIKLYPETAGHAANFLALARAKVYDGVTFHRVVNEFMIQSGDPSTRLDSSIKAPEVPDGVIDAEILPQYYHKRGVLAAARQADQANPTRASSNLQFYIVTGKTYAASELDQIEAAITNVNKDQLVFKYVRDPANSWLEAYARVLGDPIATAALAKTQPDSVERMKRRMIAAEQTVIKAQETLVPFKFTDAQRKTYIETGGAPALDGQYTVFGEVIKGMEFVDIIGKADVEGEKPLNPVVIRVTVLAKKDKFGPEVVLPKNPSK